MVENLTVEAFYSPFPDGSPFHTQGTIFVCRAERGPNSHRELREDMIEIDEDRQMKNQGSQLHATLSANRPI